MDNYFDTSIENNALIFHFKADLDTLACIEIEPKINEFIKSHKNQIIFDLEKVDFVASSFIRLCGTTAQAIGFENLTLTNINKRIKTIFKKVGVTSVFKIK